MTKDRGTTVRDWAAIAASPKFNDLHRRKRNFLFGWWAFAAFYYFALPLGAAFTPVLYKTRIMGVLNFGHLFALSQFFVAWAIAFHYANVANRDFDRLSRELVEEHG